MHWTSLLIGISLFKGSRAGQAVWFNTQCGRIATDRIDPILSFGKPSQHLHTLFGASNIAEDSTYDSLMASSCNKCGVKEDQSAYWFPYVYFWRNDNTYSPLRDTDSIPVYYKMNFAGNTIPKNYFQAFPKGFQLVTGNSKLRTSNRTSDMAQRTLWYVCDGDRSVFYPGFPTNRKCKTITMGINFPWCWNGQTDSADHSSHMAYPTNWETNNEMNCPSSHPLSLPMPFIEHDFNASAFQDMYAQAMNPAQPFVLASGDPTGYGIHTDFQNGWNFTALSYVMQNYKAGDRPTDLGWLTSAHPNCPEKAPSVPDNQGVPGQWLTALPGNLQASFDGVDNSTFATGTSTATAPTATAHGVYAQLSGVDIGCGNIALSQVSSVGACESACDANSQCDSFTLNGKNCYLKKYTCGSNSRWSRSTSQISGFKGSCAFNANTIGSAYSANCQNSDNSSNTFTTTSAPTLSSKTTTTTSSSPMPTHSVYSRLSGVDIFCGNIGYTVVKSLDACEAACDQTAKCTAYSLSGSNCYFKNFNTKSCSAKQWTTGNNNLNSGLKGSCQSNAGTLTASYQSQCRNSDGSSTNISKKVKPKSSSTTKKKSKATPRP